MTKATLLQRLEISECETDQEKIETWIKFGFTRNEAQAMVKGRTYNEANKEIGGTWRVGNVHYPQSISKIHAQKIHLWNFGVTESTDLIRNINGTNWVIEGDSIDG